MGSVRSRARCRASHARGAARHIASRRGFSPEIPEKRERPQGKTPATRQPPQRETRLGHSQTPFPNGGVAGLGRIFRNRLWPTQPSFVWAVSSSEIRRRISWSAFSMYSACVFSA